MWERALKTVDVEKCRVLKPIMDLRIRTSKAILSFEFDTAQACSDEMQARLKNAGIELGREASVKPPPTRAPSFVPAWRAFAPPPPSPRPVLVEGRQSWSSWIGSWFRSPPVVAPGARPPVSPSLEVENPLPVSRGSRAASLDRAPPTIDLKIARFPTAPSQTLMKVNSLGSDTVSVGEIELCFGSYETHGAEEQKDSEPVLKRGPEGPTPVESPSGESAPILVMSSPTPFSAGVVGAPGLSIQAASQVPHPTRVGGGDPLLSTTQVKLWTDKNDRVSMGEWLHGTWLSVGYSIPGLTYWFENSFLTDYAERFGMDSTAILKPQADRKGRHGRKVLREDKSLLHMHKGYTGEVVVTVYSLVVQRSLAAKLSLNSVTSQTYGYVMAFVLSQFKEANLVDELDWTVVVDTVRFIVQSLARAYEVSSAERVLFSTSISLKEGTPPSKRMG